jgi:ankyrin repeat protein
MEMTALMSASLNGHLGNSKMAHANNADVNAKTNDGRTALMSASEKSHLETVKWLIANNADVNAKVTGIQHSCGFLKVIKRKWLIATMRM